MIQPRPITTGPKHHWFGYYDKLQFDPSARYALGMEVEFEHRAPMPEDVVRVGMVDLEDGDRWVELGESRAWGWQAGCMLQWLPQSAQEIVWNDRKDGRFVCHILNIRTGRKRTLPHPIFTLSPDGQTALSIDFHRLEDMRPPNDDGGLRTPAADKVHDLDNGQIPRIQGGGYGDGAGLVRQEGRELVLLIRKEVDGRHAELAAAQIVRQIADRQTGGVIERGQLRGLAGRRRNILLQEGLIGEPLSVVDQCEAGEA